MSLQIYTCKEEIPEDVELVAPDDIDLRTDGNRFINDKLSQWCKILLSVLQNPDKCFNINACNHSALQMLALINSGHVLWEHPLFDYEADKSCNITIKNKHFSSFRQFLEFIQAEQKAC